MAEFFIEMYERLPASIRQQGDRIIRALKLTASFLMEIKLQVVLCDCTNAGDERIFQLLYVGRRDQLEPALRLFRYQLLREARRDSVYCWQLKDCIVRAREKGELPLLHLNLLLCHWLSREDLLPVLPSVQTVLPIADTLETTQATFSNTTLRKIKKLARGNYSWQICTDAASLRRFYHQFYRPSALERFGEYAQLASFPKVRRLYRTGLLFFVKRADDPVSACICRKIDGVLWTELFGFAISKGKLRDEGAGDAMYHAILELAFDLGCTHINFRDSQPFLNDGVLQYKLRWGCRLHDNRKAVRYVAVDLGRRAKTGFLPFQQHYPIFPDKGGLSGLVILSHGHDLIARELRTISNTYLRPGLAKLYVGSFSGSAVDALDIPGDTADRLKLVDLSTPNEVRP